MSVAIPVRNGAATIGEQLRAVLAQECTATFEVVVADNGSTDATAAVVAAIAARDGRVRLVAAADEGSEPCARNAAVAACRAPIVACCDADDVVRPGWLAAIVEAFAGGAHAVSVTREYWTLNPGFREAGNRRTHLNTWLAGGAFAVRRDLYLELGGFDQSMPVGADTEFGFRLQLATGRRAVLLPDAVVSVRLARDSWAVFRRARRQARTWPELRRRHPSEMTPTAADMPALRGRMAWWLLRNAPLVAGRRRLRWFEVAGTVVGELEGSIRDA